MKFTMDCKFEQKSIDKIIRDRNLENGGRVQQVVDNEVIIFKTFLLIFQNLFRGNNNSVNTAKIL